MTFIKSNFTSIAILFTLICAAQASQTVSVEKNYKGWNWENVHVAKNKYISLAVVPDAGGRILEYKL